MQGAAGWRTVVVWRAMTTVTMCCDDDYHVLRGHSDIVLGLQRHAWRVLREEGPQAMGTAVQVTRGLVDVATILHFFGRRARGRKEG